MSFLDADLEIGGGSAPLTGTVEPAGPSTLVYVEPASVETVFVAAGALDPLIDQVAALVRAHKPDVTTAKGRKEIASLAYKVAQTKTYLDDQGKDLVARYKEIPKKVDANRLAMRNRLDALRDEARRPLTNWEAEQAQIAAEQKARAEAEALTRQVETDHEMALLMDEAFNRAREDRRHAEEQARLEREERIRQEAADRARLEAETRARMEQEASIRRELESKLALERAEREKAEAEQRARETEERRVREQHEAEARAERERLAAAEREEQARQEASKAERDRQAAAQAKEEAERKAREEDREHRKMFNREALEDIRKTLAESDTDPAVSILTAIAKGQIRHTSIAY